MNGVFAYLIERMTSWETVGRSHICQSFLQVIHYVLFRS